MYGLPARLEKSENKLSNTDWLTGLSNRHRIIRFAFTEAVEKFMISSIVEKHNWKPHHLLTLLTKSENKMTQ